MNEPEETFSNQELIERIIALEGEIRFLKTENKRLTARMDDFQKGFRASLDTNLHQFKSIWDALWPVVDKVFPKFRAAQNQVEAIIPPNTAHPSIDTRPKDYKRD